MVPFSVSVGCKVPLYKVTNPKKGILITVPLQPKKGYPYHGALITYGDWATQDMQQLDDQLQIAKLALTDLVENLATKRQIREIPEILKIPEIPNGTPKGTPKGETRTEVAHPELPHLPHVLASEEASPAASPQGKWAFATSAAANIGPAPTTGAATTATKADLARRGPTETAKTAETRGGSLAGRLRSEVEDDELPDTSNGMLAFLQAICKKMVLEERSKAAKFFECTMCLVIFVNAIVQGVEAELSLTSDTLYWAVPVEYGFLTMYIIELIIRIIAKAGGYFDLFFLGTLIPNKQLKNHSFC